MERALSDLAQGGNFATSFSGNICQSQMEEGTIEDSSSLAFRNESAHFRLWDARRGWEMRQTSRKKIRARPGLEWYGVSDRNR